MSLPANWDLVKSIEAVGLYGSGDTPDRRPQANLP